MENSQIIAKAVARRLGDFQAAKAACRREKLALFAEEVAGADLAAARGIAQAVAREVQEKAHRRVAEIVTHALAAVFDTPYTFKIIFTEKRGKTEAELVFERDGMQIDPMGAAGGGVLDVAGFALRLSCICLSKPPVRRFIAMDEPMKFLSAEFRPRARMLLESLAKDLGFQMLIVTHLSDFKIGNVIEL